MSTIHLRSSTTQKLARWLGRRAIFSAHASRNFTVLGLESSADDTCAAVVTSSRDILSNVVLKQLDLIHPLYAARAHQRRMPHAIREALSRADKTMDEIDGIAFTRGPGMPGGLGVCSTAARSLAAALRKPVVGVHHMQAHALTPLLTSPPSQRPHFPFLTLLISGGHTLLLLASSPASFRMLATTPDESIGRSFDKVSRMLELEWSSNGPGAALEQFCETGDSEEDDNVPDLPLMPKVTPGQLMFSYSGLHSVVERYITRRGGIAHLDTKTRRALARAFQTAAVAQLEEKLGLGLAWCVREQIHIQHVVVSGGVASNSFLRSRLQYTLQNASQEGEPISLVFPPVSLCTDNAVMIAWASMCRFLAQDYDDIVMDIRPEWSIEDLSPLPKG